jgi:tetratricopeptide (TPR) repeat protein
MGCWALGEVHLAQGNLLEAVIWLEGGLELTEEHNLASLFSIIAADLGRCYALSGRVAEAVNLHETGAAKSASMNLMANHPRNLALLGEAYLLAGRPNDAACTAERALQLSRVHGQRGLEADVLRILGEISANREPPEVDRAESSYGEAFALAEELGMRPLTARCHLGLGTLYQQTGDRAKAEHHLTRATTLFQEMDMRFWLQKAEAEMKQPG